MGGNNSYQGLLEQGYTQQGEPTYYDAGAGTTPLTLNSIYGGAQAANPQMWRVTMQNDQGNTMNVPYQLGENDVWGYNRSGVPTLMGGGNNQRGKTTAELSAEQAAKNAAIAQQKANYDAQMNQQFSGNFDFLNKPMEVNPFQVQNGQAIMGRPTYGGQAPDVGNYSMSSAFQSRGPQTYQGQQGQPQADLGQMYSLFQNPYLAELATLLFGNSSWLK